MEEKDEREDEFEMDHFISGWIILFVIGFIFAVAVYLLAPFLPPVISLG